MRGHVVAQVGPPQGREGQSEKGYSLGQAMEMHLAGMDFLCDELEKIERDMRKLRDEITRVARGFT